MNHRTPKLLGTAIVAVLTLSACSSASSGGAGTTTTTGTGATINIGSLYEPQNLDNTAGGGQGITEAFNGNVYEGLFRLTDTGDVEPLLAANHTVSTDGLTYTFTLRKGVTFQSGKVLTSADVKHSIEQVISDSSKSARKSSFPPISAITTPDDSTVVVTLGVRSISFIYNLSYVWIVNSQAIDRSTTADGTGPYRLADWKRGSSLSLERNDRYWGNPAKNAEVVFHYFTDATAQNNALLTGDVDVVTSVQSPDALSQLAANPAYVVSDGKSTTKLLLAFNDRVAPFDNVDVRRAVSSAIDNTKLLKSIWGDHGTLIGSMVPPTDPWYEDLTGVNPYDIALAKNLLSKAGYANGFAFTLDTPTYDPHPVVAEFIRTELAKVGIAVTINPVTADEWYQKVYKAHNFVATLQEHVNDRDVVWYGNPNFYWGYRNPDVTSWIAQAEQVGTQAEQVELLKKANRQIVQDAASDWLYLYPQIVVAATGLKGYPVNGLNSQFFAYNITKG